MTGSPSTAPYPLQEYALADYTVYFGGFAETFVKVRADDPDEAIDMAWDRVHPRLCHQCVRELELGDEWEATFVIDDATDKAVWEKGR